VVADKKAYIVRRVAVENCPREINRLVDTRTEMGAKTSYSTGDGTTLPDCGVPVTLAGVKRAAMEAS